MADYKEGIYVSKIYILGKLVPVIIERVDSIGKFSIDSWDENRGMFSNLCCIRIDELLDLAYKIKGKESRKPKDC